VINCSENMVVMVAGSWVIKDLLIFVIYPFIVERDKINKNIKLTKFSSA
jgi:hypothetical protein